MRSLLSGCAAMVLACAHAGARQTDAFLNAEPITSDASPWVIEGELTQKDPVSLHDPRTRHDIVEVHLDAGVFSILYLALPDPSRGVGIDPYLRVDRVHDDGREEHLLAIDDGPPPFGSAAYVEARISEPVVLRLSLGVLNPREGAYRVVIVSDAADRRPVAPLSDLARLLRLESEAAHTPKVETAGSAERVDSLAESQRVLQEMTAVQGSDWWEVIVRRQQVEEHRAFARLESDLRNAMVQTEWRAKLYEDDGDDALAAEEFLQLSLLVRKLQGADHPGVARALSRRGAALLRSGLPTQARGDLKQVLDAVRARDQAPTPALAEALTDLARAEAMLGRLSEAEVLLIEAMRIREHLHPRLHPDTLHCAAELARVLAAMGRDREASELMDDVFAARRLVLPPTDPTLIATLSDLANSTLEHVPDAHRYRRLLCETAAESRLPLLQAAQRQVLQARAQRPVSGTVAPDDIKATAASSVLAFGPIAPGDAEARYRSLLTDHAHTLGQLGDSLLSMGEYARAATVLQQAAVVARAASGGNSVMLAQTYALLSRAWRALHEPERARHAALEACAIRESLYQGDHPDTASSLADLAQLHMDAGEWEDARRLLERAQMMHDRVRTFTRGDTESRVLMDRHLSITQVARSLARVYVELGEQESALAALDAGRARAFMDIFVADGKLATPDQVTSQITEAQRAETEARSRVRDLEAELFSLSAEHGADAWQSRDAKSRLAQEREQLREAVAHTNALRGRWVPAMRAHSAADIRRWTEGAVVLAYAWDREAPFVIAYENPSDNARHALLVHPGGPDASAINQQVSMLAESLRHPGRLEDEEVLRLAEVLIPPEVRETVLQAQKLVVIADGPLSAIPMTLLIDALASDQGEARGQLPVHAPSVSLFLHVERRRTERKFDESWKPHARFVIVADPDFATPGPSTDRAAPSGSAAMSELRGAQRDGSFQELPGTRAEADLIISGVRAAEDASYVGLLASEATVPALTQAVLRTPPRVLHIATHGVIGSVQHPMNAALVLARDGSHSPFLTLEDLLRDWTGRLQNTELVVLSACETGRGVDAGDSEYSLPWGFFAAGTTAVVASLWQVDDISTALLMARFHENRLGTYTDQRRFAGGPDSGVFRAGRPMRTVNALNEAQEWVRSLTFAERDAFFARHPGLAGVVGDRGTAPVDADALEHDPDLRPYEHPHYWAGFILLGSPD